LIGKLLAGMHFAGDYEALSLRCVRKLRLSCEDIADDPLKHEINYFICSHYAKYS